MIFDISKLKTEKAGIDVHMNEQTSNDKWCSKKEIAAHFGIGVRTVTDWMRRRIIPFVKVGHVVRF